MTVEEKTALTIAQHVVTHYESADARAAEFQRRFHMPDEAKATLADAYRAMVGGEELYRASKAFLEGVHSAGQIQRNRQRVTWRVMVDWVAK